MQLVNSYTRLQSMKETHQNQHRAEISNLTGQEPETEALVCNEEIEEVVVD
jgi:hypothetical protein